MVISFSNKDGTFSTDYVYFEGEMQLTSNIDKLKNSLLEEEVEITKNAIKASIANLKKIKQDKVIEFNDQVLEATKVITQLLIAASNKKE